MSDPNHDLPNAAVRRPAQGAGNWGSLRSPTDHPDAVMGERLSVTQALDAALMRHVREDAAMPSAYEDAAMPPAHEEAEMPPVREDVRAPRRDDVEASYRHREIDTRRHHQGTETAADPARSATHPDDEAYDDRRDPYHPAPASHRLESEMYRQAQPPHLWDTPLPPEGEAAFRADPSHVLEPPFPGSFGPMPRHFGHVPPPPPAPRSRRIGLAVTALVAAGTVIAGTLTYGVVARDGRPNGPSASAPGPRPTGSVGAREGVVPPATDRPVALRTAALSGLPGSDPGSLAEPAGIRPPAPAATPAPSLSDGPVAAAAGAAGLPIGVLAALPGKTPSLSGGETEIRMTPAEAPPRAAAPGPAPLPPDTVAAMRGRAEQLIGLGQVTGARAILLTLAETGDSRSLFLYAGTYDPRVLQGLKAVGIKSDPDMARRYYRLAAEAGVGEARARLDGL